MPPIHHDLPSNQAPPPSVHSYQKLQPDPLRAPPPHYSTHSKNLSGRGPNNSHRHLHHQRGTIGTFHVKLLEGRNLRRRHWSALSLGPVKHLGLSRAHGEVSSFGRGRLAFWRDGEYYCDNGCDCDWNDACDDDGRRGQMNMKKILQSKSSSMAGSNVSQTRSEDSYFNSFRSTVAPSSVAASHSYESNLNDQNEQSAQYFQQSLNNNGNSNNNDDDDDINATKSSFMPSLNKTPSTIPMHQQQQQYQQKSKNSSTLSDVGKSPLTPIFDQGCIRSFSPARSPFFAAFPPSSNKMQQHPNQQQQQHHQKLDNFDNIQALHLQNSGSGDSGFGSDTKASPPKTVSISNAAKNTSSKNDNNNKHNNHHRPTTIVGPPPPHHYAKEEFQSCVIHHDSNPIWGHAPSNASDNNTNHGSNNNNNNNNNNSTNNSNNFHIPLQKDDLYPTLHQDSSQISLEIRLDEDMTTTESLIVGGALTGAVVSAASVASSVVVGANKAQMGAEAGMELLGLGKDRLIGRGYVDLMPLLLGWWEEDWEVGGGSSSNNGDSGGNGNDGDGGKFDGEENYLELDEYGRIPTMAHRWKRRVERMGMLDVWVPLYHPNSKESSGKVHLQITYEPNGMTPKANDVVAFESFARRPETSSITPIVPPLSPLLVIDTRGSYLLLEYANSRTVTSVDRSGNVKSTRWERTHRIRIHRNSVFVIERPTLMDAAGSLARLPGDIVLSTPLGREVAEMSAPLVAAATELMGPALLWGKLMVATGRTGVQASLAGAQAATEAVVRASQEKALRNRDSGYVDELDGGDVGVYRYGI